MKKQVFINGKYLRALSLLSAKDDIRYYVNAVNLRFKTNSVIIEATDHLVVGALKINLPEQIGGENQFQPDDCCIIPIECLAKINPKVHYIITQEDGIISIKSDGFCASEPEIQAIYPDIPKWFKDQCSKEIKPSNFDPELLNRFRKVGKILDSNNTPILIQRGMASVTVLFQQTPNFIGGISPFWPLKEPTIPEWVFD
ncbi:hypothetical protein [Snodgrassella alvi]|jgi:hypothetical protein|uniref:hypothetical protein n=1 Tax=Snodgrassella alvi TaxID=1196083 RepID=UPI000C1E782B|nr:hypothetical protein [Snodgrassella alvi]PIT21471.1 hypothetical protein BGI34_01310 [Snodgrassella alvi]